MKSINRHNVYGSTHHHQLEVTLDEVRACLHRDIKLLDGWVISLPRLDARSDEPSTTLVDLSTIWLPPNSVYPYAQHVTDQPRFSACLVLAVSSYWSQARAQKSRTSLSKALIASLSKFIEYAWLHDKFDLSSWNSVDFEVLARDLAKGGWQYALQISARLTRYCEERSAADLSKLIRSDFGVKQKNINTTRFRAALGTNVQGREPKIFYEAMRRLALSTESDQMWTDSVEGLISNAQPERPSASMLRQTFEALNHAFDLPLGVGFHALPYPNGHVFSKKLGTPTGRTANLSAEQASLLFAESFRWLYRYGPILLKLLADICDSVVAAHRNGRNVKGYDLEDVLRRSEWRQWLDENLPAKIQGIDAVERGGPSLSVRSAMLCLFSACFFLTATMNARRKDEIAHRRFGLHQGCVRSVDQAMELYEAEFYIEKTYCDYMSFYVNRTTRDVVDLLERIQALFDMVDIALGRRNADLVPVRERALFTYRRLSRIEGVGADRCWFNFETRVGGNSERFVSFALGDMNEVNVTPHMFRRAYALIFFYRYSNATLQALSSQMRHMSLGTTMVYVTDPWFIEDAKRVGSAFVSNTTQRKRAFSLEIKGMKKQLSIVGDEMLVDTVLEILMGKPSLGGYGRFIRFIYSKLTSLIEFDKQDLRESANRIFSIVKKRGHAPLSMRHGQCMAGTTASVHLGRCRDRDGASLHREHASPAVCANCAYHYSNAAYLENLRADLCSLNEVGMSGDTLEALVALKSARNLQALINLHTARLKGGDHESATI